jgi:hypothetical protein
MLTFIGGNIHFGQRGQRIGISYTNTLELEVTVTANISYDPLTITYAQVLTKDDTLGSIPNISAYNYTNNTTRLSYSYVPGQWDPSYPWSEPTIESVSISTQTQLWAGIISLTIPNDAENGTIIYIPYYKSGADELSGNTSLLQVRVTGLFIGFQEDENLSWFTSNRSDTIPNVNGYSGWDLFWNEDLGTWGFIENLGGGRYKETLIAIGQDDNGNGCIYYTV